MIHRFPLKPTTSFVLVSGEDAGLPGSSLSALDVAAAAPAVKGCPPWRASDLYRELPGHVCVGLFLGLLVCPIHLCVCPPTNTTQPRRRSLLRAGASGTVILPSEPSFPILSVLLGPSPFCIDLSMLTGFLLGSHFLLLNKHLQRSAFPRAFLRTPVRWRLTGAWCSGWM